jgi:ribonuclease HI
MKFRIAYTDGACRISNPGLCSCAWVLYEDGIEVAHDSRYLGHQPHTNNYAEYMGLTLLLEHLYRYTIKNVRIYSDSALVVNQVNGRWNCNFLETRQMVAKIYGLLEQGGHSLHHIKGHEGYVGNERADYLCNEVLDEHMEEYYANSQNIIARPTA